MQPRLAELKERVVCVVPHHGDPHRIDDTRRPLYRHMIQHELVGGPSIVRWLDKPEKGHVVDALVQTYIDFEGDEVCTVERLSAGLHAVLDFEGNEAELEASRHALRLWVDGQGLRPAGSLLQVHLMDAIDGITEQELQLPVVPA